MFMMTLAVIFKSTKKKEGTDRLIYLLDPVGPEEGLGQLSRQFERRSSNFARLADET
jgi:hypothetical protein